MFEASRQVSCYYQSRHQHILTYWIFLFFFLFSDTTTSPHFYFLPVKFLQGIIFHQPSSIDYAKVFSPSLRCRSSLIVLLPKWNQLECDRLSISILHICLISIIDLFILLLALQPRFLSLWYLMGKHVTSYRSYRF